jgi:D-glucuronyl C5-epimerase-like protein
MRGRTVILAALAAVLAAPATAAGGVVGRDAAAAKRGLTAAAKSGQLPSADAATYRGTVDRALAIWGKLHGSRAANLAGALHDAAALAGRYDTPRALTIFSGLDVNTTYFGTKATPAGTIDVEGDDRIVYRYFPGHGLQFHPLANFARLNAHAVRKDDESALQLSESLLERAVPSAAGLTWEYEFPFGGGRAPWTSGMAQAAAAQAFSRASTLLEDPALLDPASQAYRAAQALVRTTPAGPWVRLYSFSSMAVLNAQLQTALSIAEYARTSANADAALFADRLEQAAATLLPEFDTGAWSLYALGGAEADLHYHKYVVSLLERLAQLDERPEWSMFADQFGAYLLLPPDVTPVSAVRVVYPQPRDDFRDRASVTFDLSKTATVRFVVAGERRPVTLRRGRHTLTWDPGTRPPQAYAAALVATDLAGNTAEVPLQSIDVRRDSDPPEITAALAGRRLTWQAIDEGTPWLRLQVVFENGQGRRRVDLRTRPLAGAATVKVPAGRWGVRLVATDSSGNQATVPLGATT